ncbi:sulfite reductase (NADPH) flavoprotein alpha-component [Yoonia tamlensis]|uniref:NADPH--hemoprotein reductase n=1 Tax=Yoonia tamlensis TaxID=390270 RepID=A0A1I6H068_9RHOB|nr:PepSY domain-containing protein [Yoonia tamlensis]SFR47661.1 sulfite reductase (NADPH) flavoprotein alpha-component [Yoonia tamlensis]
MSRSIHAIVGLGLSVLLMVLAISGAVLATKPVYDQIAPQVEIDGVTVADMLRALATAHPAIISERIVRKDSGQFQLSFTERNRRNTRLIDPKTGEFLPEHKEPAIYTFMRDLHRSFTFGEAGRVLAAIGGFGMLVLTITGTFLLLRRLGGLRQIFAPVHGRGMAGIHALLGRLLVLPLMVTAATALWLSAVSFDLISSGADVAPSYPESHEELAAVAPWDLEGLKQTALHEVKEIVFPIPEDWFDVWAIKTTSAWVFYDQFTGVEISRDPVPVAGRLLGFIMLLHTAQGVWPWAIVLFVSSLAVPYFIVSGAVVWWQGRKQGGKRIRNNAALKAAEILILVGTEGRSTWRFAKALHVALHAAGKKARMVTMNEMPRDLCGVSLIIAMTATYGDGDAPQSADKFLTRLAKTQTHAVSHMSLGFGDKAFSSYCRFAHQANDALVHKFGPPVMPLCEIDKQSEQSFQTWCNQLSAYLTIALDVRYTGQRPKTRTIRLQSTQTFGARLGTTTAILRFDADRLPDHRPGDLVQVFAPALTVPRLYSLGSDAKADGYLEIVVRRVEGGLCSNWLCDLEAGAQIDVAIVRNARFQMPRRKPVVMVGAGTGIAPFTGMIRHNRAGRPVDLYWGGRHPDVDALYVGDISHWLESKRLHTFGPAWSRNHPSQYVQDRLIADRGQLLARLKSGATIMVCGGTAMAAAIRTEIDILAAEIGLSADELKRTNRYLEDVY